MSIIAFLGAIYLQRTSGVRNRFLQKTQFWNLVRVVFRSSSALFKGKTSPVWRSTPLIPALRRQKQETSVSLRPTCKLVYIAFQESRGYVERHYLILHAKERKIKGMRVGLPWDYREMRWVPRHLGTGSRVGDRSRRPAWTIYWAQQHPASYYSPRVSMCKQWGVGKLVSGCFQLCR